jgi:hypothetical protein
VCVCVWWCCCCCLLVVVVVVVVCLLCLGLSYQSKRPSADESLTAVERVRMYSASAQSPQRLYVVRELCELCAQVRAVPFRVSSLSLHSSLFSRVFFGCLTRDEPPTNRLVCKKPARSWCPAWSLWSGSVRSGVLLPTALVAHRRICCVDTHCVHV